MNQENTVSIPSATLIERARAGCSESTGKLMEFYRPYFLKIAEDTVGSDLRPKLAPSDVVQGSLVLAAKNIAQFEGQSEDDLRPWMLTIFRNHLMDGIRRFRYTERRDIDREVTDVESQLPDNVATVEEFASAKEEVDRLLVGIERLPEQSRRIVRMRYLENLSFVEIAAQLDCTKDHARRVWLRAIDELGRELHE